MARIRVGIGGWTFVPWRNNFFPKGLRQADELSFASRHVSSIEINGTFYSNQKPASFRRWAGDTPDDFIFSVKANRYITQRKLLAEAEPSMAQFLNSGLVELGPKLGPILWQFGPTKKFDPEDFEAFLAMLPKELEGRKLRHVVEVRHMTFCTGAFIDLVRRYGIAVCLALSEKYPLIPDVTSDFIYARLQTTKPDEPAGYTDVELDRWAGYAKSWMSGKAVDELPLVSKTPHKSQAVDCFIYFIAGAKERNPAAAQSFMRRF